MGFFTTLKALINANINTNGVQAITGAIHNDVMIQLVDALGAKNVYFNPATTDNPGTPENNRAYIAFPGTYTNFGNLTITAPLGVLSWNAATSTWSVTQLSIPSPFEYFRAKTTDDYFAGNTVTSLAISQTGGLGYTAYAGTWVQLIDRKTGVYDHVQLSADMAATDVSISVTSWELQEDFSAGAIVEVFPVLNMRKHVHIPVAGAGLNYVDLPFNWRFPKDAVQKVVWEEYVEAFVDNSLAVWDSSPAGIAQYKIIQHPTENTWTRMQFGDTFTGGEIVRVKLIQPIKLLALS